ncbi:related to DNA mismatch repair protein MLH1 [Saccharomycodes ludwigii]|uniref:Related to DNA mismatch repair protein MLH1 n=1 Tax=Saccharomycodes ludwigii TaxID=36035 RepID=A0A376B7I7_9ASCO|nr:related to DNA mismatch repair protein MLH1 [Saccharomycodes ludwigii]
MSIKKLDPDVINKIAAGEIIISPTNALKELIENSIDASSKSIDISIQNNGFKILQISDDGSGIKKEDYPILCHRFTTSKITKFEDLSEIDTFGFRGEALSSISHIAHLSVTSKRRNEDLAWKCQFERGQMIDETLKPSAGNQGTTITVSDLFYNVPSRLRSLRQKDEFNKIFDVIGKYAINNPGIAFSLRKIGDSRIALVIKKDLNIKDRIRTIYTSIVSNDLIDFNINVSAEDTDDYGKIGFISCSGMVANLNYSNQVKRNIQPIFFINNRLVTCDPLKRSIDQTYSSYLPRGASRPFVYLNIKLNPRILDVNVHPTKSEVRFLHEEEIINIITLRLHEFLSKLDSSRTFKANTFSASQMNSASTPSSNKHKNILNSSLKRQESKLVRIDSEQARITSFMSQKNVSLDTDKLPTDADGNPNSSFIEGKDDVYINNEREVTKVELTSIQTLKQLVDENSHYDLTNIFANLTYIGVIDYTKRLAAIQYDLKLFMVDYGAVCYELFYQIGLSDFANYGKIYLNKSGNGLNIKEILSPIKSANDAQIKMYPYQNTTYASIKIQAAHK